MMGPVGKCLEAALEELLAADGDVAGADASMVVDTTTTAQGARTDTGGGEDGDCAGTDSRPGKRRRLCEDASSADDNEPATKMQNAEGNGGKETSTSEVNSVRLDEATAKSIIEAYGSAVAETKFDDEGGSARFDDATTPGRHHAAESADPAPAALLLGEVDHFNRVGGQWRVAVKNAVLTSRSMIRVGNGMAGRSVRYRRMLDWESGGAADDDKADDRSEKEGGLNDAGKAKVLHRFDGPIQILAYDDDT